MLLIFLKTLFQFNSHFQGLLGLAAASPEIFKDRYKPLECYFSLSPNQQSQSIKATSYTN